MTNAPSLHSNTSSALSDLLSDQALAELGFQMAKAEVQGEEDLLAPSLSRSQRACVRAAGLHELACLVVDYSQDLLDWNLKIRAAWRFRDRARLALR